MASLFPRQTRRQKQVAEAFNLTPLFEIPYQIIGQRLAAKTVSVGELLSLPFLKVDCTHISYETDLFGAQAPYEGWQDGSPLNNFLTDTDGHKAVVFLDEFDKMDHAVYNSLLLPFDEGFYTDRRRRPHGKPLDSSNIIWVLASNHGEAIIQKFWDDHLADDKPEHHHHQLLVPPPLDSLRHSLERSFHSTLGAPLTGRLTAIIPFMPFSRDERAVTTYKFMRRVFHESRKDISVDDKTARATSPPQLRRRRPARRAYFGQVLFSRSWARDRCRRALMRRFCIG
ncbi:MAG: hypothetical protein Q9216_003329 [Gyalolechia sp. 2 TL-2023]